MHWEPQQYLRFGDERLRPAADLLARVPLAAAQTVVDLGCGAGTLVPLFLKRWPQCRVTGVDSSPTMLARARAEHPQAEVCFVQADVATWRPAEPVDLLYSNATLHWLDGHDALLPALLATVKPGGYLAIQMPRNFAAPSHTCIYEAIEQGPWRARLAPLWRPRPVAEPAHYWRLLHDLAATLDLWECEYLQVLRGENPVAEFVKGSWLKPFLDQLDEAQRGAFWDDYCARVRLAYPREADGHTLFPFRRLFLVAQRA